MLLSKSCEHGLRAALYLTLQDDDAYVSIRDISDRLGISFTFLTKVFQQLNDAGLVDSRRGRYGGVTLARAPESIPLYEIIAAIDGESLFHECVLGLPNCGSEKPCPLHREWTRQRDQLELLFRRAHLSDIAARADDAQFRLTVDSLTNPSTNSD